MKASLFLLASAGLAACSSSSLPVDSSRLVSPSGPIRSAEIGQLMVRLDRPSTSATRPSALEVRFLGLAANGAVLLEVRDLNAPWTARPVITRRTKPPSPECQAVMWVFNPAALKDGVTEWKERLSTSARCLAIAGVQLRWHEKRSDRLSFEVVDLSA